MALSNPCAEPCQPRMVAGRTAPAVTCHAVPTRSAALPRHSGSPRRLRARHVLFKRAPKCVSNAANMRPRSASSRSCASARSCLLVPDKGRRVSRGDVGSDPAVRWSLIELASRPAVRARVFVPRDRRLCKSIGGLSFDAVSAIVRQLALRVCEGCLRVTCGLRPNKTVWGVNNSKGHVAPVVLMHQAAQPIPSVDTARRGTGTRAVDRPGRSARRRCATSAPGPGCDCPTDPQSEIPDRIGR